MALTTDPTTSLRFFEDAVGRLLSEPRTGRPWSPPVDIIETEDAVILKADLPDIDPKDIDIQVENQTLTIKGQRQFEKEANGKGYHRIERSYGTFMRSFILPSTVDTEKVSAEYKNGVLTISLPKRESAKPRQVKVGVNAGNGAAQSPNIHTQNAQNQNAQTQGTQNQSK
jgi:HSP20 family protein